MLLAGLEHLIERLLDLRLVARQDLRDERQLDVHFLGAVLQRAHVLGQARAAEGEPRLEVVGRKVQLLVAAEDVHHLVAVDVELLAQVADLVREHHLERMPGVARVLHHLGDADAGADERRVDRLVERDRAARVGGVVVADQGQRRLAEILERRPLAQELRVHRDAEAVAVLLARLALERRDHQLVGRARQHRAADDDDVVVVLVAQGSADLLADPLEVLQVEAAVLAARRADAEQRDVGAADGVRGVGGRAQAAVRDALAQQILEAGLDDRTAASVDRRHLVGVDVDADHLVAVTGERRRRHAADIAKAKHGHSHRTSPWDFRVLISD